MRVFFLFLVLATLGTSAAAQTNWHAQQLTGGPIPPEIVTETRAVAAGLNGLPDGLIATHDSGDIVAAWYAGPTTRYGHGVIGDAIEAASLVVRMNDGNTLSLQLSETEVFEDRYPRLADLDGDGTVEVVAIRSSVNAGASVTVYGIVDGALVERASTGFIGRANRWLNVAGIANFTGSGGKQIAFVRTPHIGGTLFIFAFRDGALVPVAHMEGFSNHAIGSRELRLSAVTDIDGDGRADLALPSANRRSLRLIRFGTDGAVEIASIALPSQIDKAIATAGNGSDLRFIVGLKDGTVYAIRR